MNIGIAIRVGNSKPSAEEATNPTVVLSGASTYTGSMVVTATYSEPMTGVSGGFSTDDLIVTVGSNLGFNPISSTVYEWTVSGDKGGLSCYVPADTSQSIATGLNNLVSNTFEATEA